MRNTSFLFLIFVACGTTPNHPAVLGDCSKQPCTVPPTGGGTTGIRDSGTEGSVVTEAGTDTGVDSGGVDSGVVDTGVVDTGTQDAMIMEAGDEP